jgi:hypothetical protein
MFQSTKLLKLHDDGDATVLIGREKYVVTTDGRIFKEVNHFSRK